jgi:hypothetical protein
MKNFFFVQYFPPRKPCRLWDVEKYGTDDNKIGRMRFARWINKATDTQSEYVILITFPRQQWVSENAPLLRYTCIASLLTLVIVRGKKKGLLSLAGQF